MKNKTALLCVFLCLVIIFNFFSCSVLKQKHKNEQKENVDTEIKTNSQVKTESSTDEKNKIVTTEKVDTLVKIPGSIISGSKSLDDLQKSPLILTDKDVEVTVSITDGKLDVKSVKKPQVIPVRADRRTERTEDIKKKEDVKSTSSLKVEEDKKTENVVVDTSVKKSFSLPWWIWLILILLIIALVAYKLMKQTPAGRTIQSIKDKIPFL